MFFALNSAFKFLIASAVKLLNIAVLRYRPSF
uniref:Uncharacterized protein n=1 Tax=uncultured marine proteobacterium TaxID=482892 RepID=Q8RTS5_9PROT|nr:hypothetical protein MBMO_EBAC000-65D09.58 [uncultured marine proteobacterium]